MTVRELIAELSKLPPDALVVCQKDPEGNGYSPLYSISELGGYVPDTTWSGDRYELALTPELKRMGYTEEDVRADAQPAVFLCPVN